MSRIGWVFVESIDEDIVDGDGVFYDATGREDPGDSSSKRGAQRR